MKNRILMSFPKYNKNVVDSSKSFKSISTRKIGGESEQHDCLIRQNV